MSESKKKIAVGYKVGKLTVASDTGERKNGYIIWWCACECGGGIRLDTRALQRGLTVDCGCVSAVKPRQKDLTGQRFGKLTAAAPTDQRDNNGVTCWKCICDCGRETIVSASMLKKGFRKSCGCLRTKVGDLTGKTFGSLKVEEYLETRNGKKYWKCRCVCGKETTVRQTYLINGKTKSCGCLQAKRVLDNMKFVDGTSVTLLKNASKRHNSSNSSGYNGVYFNRKNQKWIAQITFKKKNYYLGSFTDIQEAVQIRKDAEERIYGEFLNWYYGQI